MTTARARRVAGASVVAGALVASVAFGGISPAAAVGDGDMLVSADGVTFAEGLTAGLFDGLGPLIPGGSATASVWVKNATDTAAEMRVSARDVGHSSDEFAQALHLSTRESGRAPGSTGDARSVGSLGECDVLIPSQSIAAGGVTKLTFTFDLHDLDGTTAQGGSANLNVLVAMRDADAGPFASSACSDEGVLISSNAGALSALATTGAGASMALLAAAGLLLGAGGRLVMARRRRRGEER